MNNYHKEIIELLQARAGEGTKLQKEREQRYDGTSKFCYCINQPTKTEIIKRWIKEHPNLTFSEYSDLLNKLFNGNSHDEIIIGGKLLSFLPKLRSQLSSKVLDHWLNHVEGWLEIDSICQSNFSANELLDNWDQWEELLTGFSKDNNVAKRRASLVLLTAPVRKSSNQQLVDMAFLNIERLKAEKDILITKAISWLLRDLIKNHKKQVENYLSKNSTTLPKVAAVAPKITVGIRLKLKLTKKKAKTTQVGGINAGIIFKPKTILAKST